MSEKTKAYFIPRSCVTSPRKLVFEKEKFRPKSFMPAICWGSPKSMQLKFSALNLFASTQGAKVC